MKSNNTLIKIEQEVAKEPTITTVTKIASALGVSIDELVNPVRDISNAIDSAIVSNGVKGSKNNESRYKLFCSGEKYGCL